MREKIEKILDGVIHPETGEGIASSGIAEIVTAEQGHVTVKLHFAKARDPFAQKIRRQVEEVLTKQFPESEVLVTVVENAPKKTQTERPSGAGSIAHTVAVASGKGGVGKSTVTANLALTLRNMGYRVGVLDADIYGPSQPRMFGCEGYMPEAEHDEQTGVDYILPAEVMDIKLMSIGFFVKPEDSLMWRGAMASNALKQFIHQTKWGTLDFLLIDLPPGTGDIHIQLINELKLDGSVIVSTPQQVAVADVRRGVAMFRHPQVNVPVTGIVENMAWFTPEELPENRYYLFGRGGARRFAEENGVPFLGEIPIVQSVMEGSEKGVPAAWNDVRVERWYRDIAERIVEKVVLNG